MTGDIPKLQVKTEPDPLIEVRIKAMPQYDHGNASGMGGWGKQEKYTGGGSYKSKFEKY